MYRSRRSKSARRRVCQWATSTGHRSPAYCRDGSSGRPTVRHLAAAKGITRLRQQNTRQVSTTLTRRVINRSRDRAFCPCCKYDHLRREIVLGLGKQKRTASDQNVCSCVRCLYSYHKVSASFMRILDKYFTMTTCELSSSNANRLLVVKHPVEVSSSRVQAHARSFFQR